MVCRIPQIWGTCVPFSQRVNGQGRGTRDGAKLPTARLRERLGRPLLRSAGAQHGGSEAIAAQLAEHALARCDREIQLTAAVQGTGGRPISLRSPQRGAPQPVFADVPPGTRARVSLVPAGMAPRSCSLRDAASLLASLWKAVTARMVQTRPVSSPVGGAPVATELRYPDGRRRAPRDRVRSMPPGALRVFTSLHVSLRITGAGVPAAADSCRVDAATRSRLHFALPLA